MKLSVDLSTFTEDPWINLAAAVVLQAILDARSESRYVSDPAMAWLRSVHGMQFLDLLNLNLDAVLRWLKDKGRHQRLSNAGRATRPVFHS